MLVIIVVSVAVKRSQSGNVYESDVSMERGAMDDLFGKEGKEGKDGKGKRGSVIYFSFSFVFPLSS